MTDLNAITRRTVLALAPGVCGMTTLGCSGPLVTLTEVLAPARDRLLDGHGRRLDVDGILSASSGQATSLTFGYVGCGGPTSLATRITNAAASVGHAANYNIVLDAVDNPKRYPEVVRDVIGDQKSRDGARRFEIGFVRNDDLSPRQGNRTVRAILAALGKPMRRDGFIQQINYTALFDRTGHFLQIRFL